jgi:hypothetical protein
MDVKLAEKTMALMRLLHENIKYMIEIKPTLEMDEEGKLLVANTEATLTDFDKNMIAYKSDPEIILPMEEMNRRMLQLEALRDNLYLKYLASMDGGKRKSRKRTRKRKSRTKHVNLFD